MLSAFSDWLFDPSGLTPHGFCLLWEPSLIWTFAVSDALIATAYFSTPLALVLVVRKRRDLVFRPLVWLFAAFILLCGTTHWLDLLTLWLPLYGILGLVKAATAVVSVLSAAALWYYMPQILSLPSPAQMNEANAALLASREQLFQIQKMEAVGQLTGGIAHDFNNLLQVISGSIDMLERRLATGSHDGTERFLEIMRQATDTAAKLTTRLLAFSRRQALRPEEVEPDHLVSRIEELIRRSIGPQIEFVVRLGDGRWSIRCDPVQLETALLNLAVNSRDAMPDGGTLTVSTADRTLTKADIPDTAIRPGRFVEIEVADTGCGMDPATLARVFEPFFTTKPVGAGTGLGLSQVHGFVSQSGGFVEIESDVGVGTKVKIFMPAHDRSENSQKEDQAPRAGKAAGPLRPCTALVVDDQQQVRSLIVEVLEQIGCSAKEAADGFDALKLLQSQRRPDLLISDVGLPGMNGRQLAETARRMFPDLPVILITGYAAGRLQDFKVTDGMVVLQKPFGMEELVRAVRRALGQDGVEESRNA